MIQCIRLWFLLLLLLPGICAAGDGVYHILVAHAYNQEYPWTKSQHQGFVEHFLSHSTKPVNFSVEYLDTKRIPLNREYMAQLERFFADKYRTYKPDLIYVTDDNGYVFAFPFHIRLAQRY